MSLFGAGNASLSVTYRGVISSLIIDWINFIEQFADFEKLNKIDLCLLPLSRRGIASGLIHNQMYKAHQRRRSLPTYMTKCFRTES